MNQTPKPKSESGKKFDEIWKQYHDPAHKEKVRLQKNRERRREVKRKDYGL